MGKEYEFIRECECFYVVTINGNFPACRPFGAIMEAEENLYLATHDGNEVHKQLRENGNIQLIAKKNGAREWLRITGVAEECDNPELKQRFMDECPILTTHYGEASSPHFLMFKVTIKNTEFK